VSLLSYTIKCSLILDFAIGISCGGVAGGEGGTTGPGRIISF